MKETSLTTEQTKSTVDDPERKTEAVDDSPATEE